MINHFSKFIMRMFLPLLCLSIFLYVPYLIIAEHSIYKNNTYVKIDMTDYATPFDTIKANNDDTVTIHYKGKQNIVPYQELNQQSFSFVLYDQKYIARAISTQSSKNKMFVQSDIMILTNEAGLAQALVKYSNTQILTSSNYGEILHRYQMVQPKPEQSNSTNQEKTTNNKIETIPNYLKNIKNPKLEK